MPGVDKVELVSGKDRRELDRSALLRHDELAIIIGKERAATNPVGILAARAPGPAAIDAVAFHPVLFCLNRAPHRREHTGRNNAGCIQETPNCLAFRKGHPEGGCGGNEAAPGRRRVTARQCLDRSCIFGR